MAFLTHGYVLVSMHGGRVAVARCGLRGIPTDVVEDWELIHRNSTLTDLSEQTHQAKDTPSPPYPTKSLHRQHDTTTMPLAFSNPWRQPVLIAFKGQTPSDSYLSQLHYWSPWWRVFWHLVWSKIHARELRAAFDCQQHFQDPPRCLTRVAALYHEWNLST